ncbi:hypothetical protein LZC95_21340 [Pendulispora brunnea]|uniref:Uncharacterized protein n=1 Tax=Pendulispora brunnea TaxID=2905690 RepID=A0ABZ2KPW0_9BACT
MSNITDEILSCADNSLAASLQGDAGERVASMTKFMECFERFARAVSQGKATWDEARPWARRNAERLCSASEALEGWQDETGRLLYDTDEEGREYALSRRSQHAFARELFDGTAADALLACYEDESVDRDFREWAYHLALDAPDYVPKTHTWWRW